MRLFAVGCSYRTTHVDLREKLAFDGEKLPRALDELSQHFECEAVILSTCNRVEMYLAQMIDHNREGETLDAVRATEFLANFHGLPIEEVGPNLYVHEGDYAVQHLFSVAASLDSMILGEGQISGQVKSAYECACDHDSVGEAMHALFQQAREVAKRVRSETGISKGHISVSSVAVDFVREVFDHFDDKTVLVIGAGKMGELTLKHLRELKPGRILVTNRSPEKAEEVARACGGGAVAWEGLDDALVEADIVLSTTGSPEPVVTMERHRAIQARRVTERGRSPVVILDIAVPRDFDPDIHDGEQTCLFNIDDLKRVREITLQERYKEVSAAESIVEQEVRRFQKKWAQRKTGPVIASITKLLESEREDILGKLLPKLNGRLTDSDREYIAGAFKLFQNKVMHGPIRALAEEVESASEEEPGQQSLLDALRKLFWLKD